MPGQRCAHGPLPGPRWLRFGALLSRRARLLRLPGCEWPRRRKALFAQRTALVGRRLFVDFDAFATVRVRVARPVSVAVVRSVLQPRFLALGCHVLRIGGPRRTTIVIIVRSNDAIEPLTHRYARASRCFTRRLSRLGSEASRFHGPPNFIRALNHIGGVVCLVSSRHSLMNDAVGAVPWSPRATFQD